MIHVTFRKEGFKTFSANFPPCARSNAHIYPRKLLALAHHAAAPPPRIPRDRRRTCCVGGVLPRRRAPHLRIAIEEGPHDLVVGASRPQARPSVHGRCHGRCRWDFTGIAVPLFAFLGKLLDHGTLVADDPVLSNRLLIAVVVVFSLSVLTYAFTYAFKVVTKLWHRRCCRRRRCYRRRRPWRQKSRTGRKARRRPARRARRRIRRRTSRC